MNPIGPTLRDIHPPPPPSWWPPAYGWWLLAVIVLLVLIVAVAWRHHGRDRRRRWNQVRRELDVLQEHHACAQDTAWLTPRLSQLLRRAARSHDRAAATACGEQWIQCVRNLAPDEATARALVPLQDAVYQRQPTIDGDRALAAARRWLEHVVRRGRA